MGLYSYNPVARTGQQNNLLTLVYTEIDNAWLLVRKQKLSYSGPYPEKKFGGGFGNDAPKAPRTSRRRRRDRDAEGVEGGGEWGGGVPLPAD